MKFGTELPDVLEEHAHITDQKVIIRDFLEVEIFPVAAVNLYWDVEVYLHSFFPKLIPR